MAELDVKERQAGDVSILDLTGAVRIGEGSVALRNAIRGLVDESKNKILLNLAGVKYMDSSGIGELIANYTTVSRGGGPYKPRRRWRAPLRGGAPAGVAPAFAAGVALAGVAGS